MIPHKIHYIWLSKQKIPNDIKSFMSSWKKYFPDYQIKCWDSTSLDIDSVDFVKEAIAKRKWAFASDYIRLYALYTEGGFYFDSDILIKKSLGPFIKDHNFVSAVEYHPSIVKETDMNDYLKEDHHSFDHINSVPGIGMQAAFMGSIKGHPFLEDCMKWYEETHFSYDLVYKNDLIAPGIYAKKAEKYGFIYRDTEQTLREGMFILPSKIIASSPETVTDDVAVIHYCAGSWRKKSVLQKIKEKIKTILFS
jgi:hypothetical protein